MSGICQEDIYKQVYFDHSEYLRNFIYYKCGDLKLAEDIVQESFLKMWENCSKVSVDNSKSYVFTVANNLLMNKFQHDKVVLKFQKRAPKQSTKIDPQHVLEEKEFQQQLEAAISNLPETQRTVFLMSRIDKKKYKEIAEELNISVKAVEKRMHKALQSLRLLYKKI